jgi:tartrate-resistant acid phosphatase type 5
MQATRRALMLGCVLALFVGFVTTTHAALKIVALGDTGTGDCNQYKVARALKRWCTANGCDFVLLLGDNFYERGLPSVCSRDPQTGRVFPDEFRRAFTDPYGPAERLNLGQTLAGCMMPGSHNLDLPFLSVLGNHDYTSPAGPAGGDPFSWVTATNQFDANGEDSPGECTDVSMTAAYVNGGGPQWWSIGGYGAFGKDCAAPWDLAACSSSTLTESVLFLGLDTTPMVGEQWVDGLEKNRQATYVMNQESYMIDFMTHSQSQWKIAFGHHPYVSNGPHGNAGHYDGLSCPSTEDKPNGWACGLRVKAFIENLCAQGLDLYLSGHDHSLQVLSANCRGRQVPFIVSGAGGKLSSLPGTNPNLGQWLKYGFVYLVINGGHIDVDIVDASTPETPQSLRSCSLDKGASIECH